VGPLTKTGALNLRRLTGRPRALVRRALHRWLAVHVSEAGLSRQAITALLDDVMRGRVTRHSLGRRGFAKISKHRLTFEPTTRKLSN
jgi:tRNA(Ile)-lysidine synthase